jgi:hypothetical protein
VAVERLCTRSPWSLKTRWLSSGEKRPDDLDFLASIISSFFYVSQEAGGAPVASTWVVIVRVGLDGSTGLRMRQRRGGVEVGVEQQ